MAIKNLLIRNNKYSGVRAVIQASQSSVLNYHYTEAEGSRYYFQNAGATAAPTMEAASFQSYLGFTMSGAVNFDFTLIPMETGESVIIETVASAVNSPNDKAYIVKTFGGWRHTGSSLSSIGTGMDYTVKTDFTNVGISFSAVGTQSIKMRATGQTSQVLDWDIYVNYTKMFHVIGTSTSGGGGTIYPKPPSLES